MPKTPDATRSPHNHIRTLEKTPLFSQLTPGQLAALADAALPRDYARGEAIFREGDPATRMFIVAAGQARIYRSTPDGREVILHIFGPGSSLAEAPALQGGRYPANAESLKNSTLLAIPRQTLLELTAADPTLALNLMAALFIRLKDFAAKIEALSLQNITQRLAAYLLAESAKSNNSNTIRLQITRATLAELLGTARESLSRTLTRLAKSNTLATKGRAIQILNRPRLQNLADGLEKLSE